jgi:hypothetical protein
MAGPTLSNHNADQTGAEIKTAYEAEDDTNAVVDTEKTEITALDALGANMVAKTGNGTYAARTITGTANEISIANGTGVSGNPTISLPSSITVDVTGALTGNADTATAMASGGTDVPIAEGGTGASTAAAARTNLGVGTGDTPQFTALNLNNSLQLTGAGATSRFVNDGDVNTIKMGGDHATQPIYLDMIGDDDADNETVYGSLRTVISADADGSEVGYIQFAMMGGNTAGSLTSDVLKIGNGVVLGGPTGGLKGYGTLNCVGAYDDNSLLSCFPFDQELDGAIDNDKWDAKVPDRTTSESVDKDGNLVAASTTERTHEGMRKFKARIGTDYDPLDIDKYAAHWKAKRHLTSMPNETKYDPVDGTLTTGEWIQRLLETVEIQAIHIEGLNQRLKALEA